MAVIIGKVCDLHTRMLKDKLRLNNAVVGQVNFLRGLGFKFTEGFLGQLKVSSPLQKLFEQGSIVSIARATKPAINLATSELSVNFDASAMEMLNKNLSVHFVVTNSTFALKNEIKSVDTKSMEPEFKSGDSQKNLI